MVFYILPSLCWLYKLAFDGRCPHMKKQRGKQKVDRPSTSHHLGRERGECGHRLFQWFCNHRTFCPPCRQNRQRPGPGSFPYRQPRQIQHLCQSVIYVDFRIQSIYSKQIPEYDIINILLKAYKIR